MDMIARMTPKVGLVQGLPFCTNREGFPAVLDKVCRENPYPYNIPYTTSPTPVYPDILVDVMATMTPKVFNFAQTVRVFQQY